MRISSTAAAYAAASLYLSPPLFHNLLSAATIIIIIRVDCFAVVRVHLRLLIVLVVRCLLHVSLQLPYPPLSQFSFLPLPLM
ncbi:unnamed protein product [Taenia asiatica]|uniref:Secreted peptide n=1 Tax=Taenia asiatica TaxID=60517 RepID=A0A0R3W740_TAEAS|nr:unnamed protein product [Taenia asiatica]